METQPRSNRPNQQPVFPIYWWGILAGLVIWTLWTAWPNPQQAVLDLPYSAFIDQVSGNNVSQVTITGGDISGALVKPLAAPAGSQAGSIQAYSSFHTHFPEVVGDTGLIGLLSSHHVQITAKPAVNPWYEMLLTGGLPLLLLLCVMAWMGLTAARRQARLFHINRSGPQEYAVEQPQVTFQDVAGEDEAKSDLQEVVDFLRSPEKYLRVGARVPRGILLVGQPGTGKTLLARAVAGEASRQGRLVPFFHISASEFVEMFSGSGAWRVQDLFQRARAASPAIVFIEALDAVGCKRGVGPGSVHDEREQGLNRLLAEMDGFNEHQEVVILAATNRPDVLDSALLRPGRFDRQVTVGLPDRQGREGVLSIHTRKLHLAPGVNLGIIARTTTGFRGADLANLCNEAALIAARKGNEQVSMADFEEALDRILLGAARSLLLNEQDRRAAAYHEAGHALVAWLSPSSDPIHKVTIVPRGLGVSEQLPGDDHTNYSKEYLLSRLAAMLGGRASEEIAVGEITTGAEKDLIEATRLARRMVTRWGMGRLGPMALDIHDEQPFQGYEKPQGREYSEATAARIDQDVQELLKERHTAASSLLAKNRARLDALAEALLRDETIGREDLERILGPRSYGASEPDVPVKMPQYSQNPSIS